MCPRGKYCIQNDQIAVVRIASPRRTVLPGHMEKMQDSCTLTSARLAQLEGTVQEEARIKKIVLSASTALLKLNTQ